MPIYESECERCGQFEATQKITDRPLGRCPTCKGKVKKLISNTYFQLKGTGWYITDYARKDKAHSDGKAEKSPPGEAKAEPKTESKSDTKADTSEKPAAEKKPAKTATSESAAS